jgi:hypothetical protein
MKGFTFSVSIYRGVRSENPRFYCPRASFRLDWLDLNEVFDSTRSIFQCSCKYDGREIAHKKELNVTCELLLGHNTVPMSHRYVVLPSSLVVRVVDGSKPAWHMYASASVLPNYVSSIYIADVESNGEFPKLLFTLRMLIVPKTSQNSKSNRRGLQYVKPIFTSSVDSALVWFPLNHIVLEMPLFLF